MCVHVSRINYSFSVIKVEYAMVAESTCLVRETFKSLLSEMEYTGLGSDAKYSWTRASVADSRSEGMSFNSLEVRSPALEDGESLEEQEMRRRKRREWGKSHKEEEKGKEVEQPNSTSLKLTSSSDLPAVEYM